MNGTIVLLHAITDPFIFHSKSSGFLQKSEGPEEKSGAVSCLFGNHESRSRRATGYSSFNTKRSGARLTNKHSYMNQQQTTQEVKT